MVKVKRVTLGRQDTGKSGKVQVEKKHAKHQLVSRLKTEKEEAPTKQSRMAKYSHQRCVKTFVLIFFN